MIIMILCKLYRISSNPGGARFSACPDRPWGSSCLLYDGYRVFPGGKVPLLVLWSLKSTAIPLPTFWATTGPVTGTLYLFTKGSHNVCTHCTYIPMVYIGLKKFFKKNHLQANVNIPYLDLKISFLKGKIS